jgi:23S rRNA pseudouridine2605 synthase
MPPRFTYWTIIAGGQPTAFRAATQDELLPTLKQLQSKQPDAVLMWFARGKLWPSEEAAAMALRMQREGTGGRDRRGADWRPGGEHKDPRDRFKVPRDVKRQQFATRARRDRIEEQGGGTPGGRPSRPVGERPTRPAGDRPFKPQGDRPFRPKGDRSFKPEGDRPFRPKADRPFKPQGERPFKPEGDRPPGVRPFRPKGPAAGERPFRPQGPRGPAGSGGGFRGGSSGGRAPGGSFPRGGNFRGGGKKGGGGGRGGGRGQR